MSAPVWRWVFSRPAVPPSEPAWCSDNQPDLPRPLSAGPAGQPLLPGPHLPGRGGEVPGGGRHQDNKPQVWLDCSDSALTDVFTLYIRFLDYKPVPEDQSSKQETIEEASEARGKIWLCPGWTLLVLLPSHYQQPVASKIACSHVPCIQDLINNFHVWNHMIVISVWQITKTALQWAGG